MDVARLEALGRDTSAMSAARTQYQNTCAPCHGPRGGGLTGPNLTDSFWIQGGSLASVRHAINLGRPARGMPGWGAVLGDAAVDRLAVYLHTVLRNTRVPEGRGPQGEPE